MKKVIVTGAGGYVGIPLCQALLSKDYQVIALDRYFFGTDKLTSISSHPNLTVVREDIRYCDTAIFKDAYAVFDLAGLSNDATAEIDPALTVSINYKGSERFAREAKKGGVQRYIYASSASVYGAGAKGSLRETDSLSPQTEYAKSKVAIETVLHELADDNFSPVMMRNATIFGLAPRMRFDLAINIMTLRAWKERVIYIMGGGEQWRPFVHVNDVVRAFMLMLESPKDLIHDQIFNVGSSELNYQIKQLAQFVIDVIPNVVIHTIPDDPDKRTYNVNFEKIQSVLDYRTTIQIHEGIVEIKQALEKGLLNGDDPTCYTLQWYNSLITWHNRIKELSYNDTIL
ncbi:SDR family oxidoreductase [Segetibacter sp. 3557_3]|jgi:nucleoside-diphosphate-sugar epimerase|uniref:NAD-dependent epimerase/dehydratase family protein n=1 Tax=Segetibacter sp. 3557_3 TaxID=2547429 RepID=UPI001058543C|nr:SDR family oxidoreductase [Segetibacter sp. 3557_3]TDH23295.1 SDR family oxidoreductase [Segetibacter sp. 3557_3]